MLARLTDREKKLMAVVVVLAVVIVGYMYVISPLLAKNTELKTSIEAQTLEKDLIIAEVAAGANIDAVYEENLKTNSELKKSFSPFLEDYEIDKLITNIAKESGVTPSNLSFSEATAAVTEEPVAEATTEEDLLATEGASEEGEVAVEEDLVQQPTTTVVSTNVTLSAGGDLQSCMKFIDNLKKHKYISIESVSITNSQTTEGSINVTLRVDTLPKA